MRKLALLMIAGLLTIPAVSAAQDRTFSSGDALRGSQPGAGPTGRRPFDDSDPEMKQLAETYFGQGPCNRGPGGRCPEAKFPLVAGGDRLALYLIDQYEASLAEGFTDTGTLLAAIAGTETKVGRDFVIARISAPGNLKEYTFALRALRRCASTEAIDFAMHILDTTPVTDSTTRLSAVKAIHRNLSDTGAARPEVMRRLEDIRVRSSESSSTRHAAERALSQLSGSP